MPAMNITTIRRGALLTAIGAGLLAPPAPWADSGSTRQFAGTTGQGRQVTLEIGPRGRVDMDVALAMRCASGASYRTATQTDAGDHFRITPTGRFRVRGSFRKPAETGDPAGVYAIGHFKMGGRLRGHLIRGVVYEYDDIYDAKGRKIDQCVDYVHTYAAHEFAT
jgi:hypothetical protein